MKEIKFNKDASNIADCLHDAEVIKLEIDRYSENKKVIISIKAVDDSLWAIKFENVLALTANDILLQNVISESEITNIPESQNDITDFVKRYQISINDFQMKKVLQSTGYKIFSIDPSVGASITLIFKDLEVIKI